MDKRINTLIKKYSNDELALDRLVVTAYVRANKLNVSEGFLASYVTDTQDSINEDIDILSQNFSIEDAISIFELAISESEKTTNGAVYTPKFIRNYVVMQVLDSVQKPVENCLCADISCGCGAFLYTLMKQIHTATNASYKDIVHNLYGVDISQASIGRAKILFSLVALQNGEIITNEDFNLFCGDTLSYDFTSWEKVQSNKGLDIIVGNPPYVRSKHISTATKQNLSLWKTSKGGNVDLYIPFFEIGMSLLNNEGILGYITVNTFFKSVNARSLRKYIHENHLYLKLIDFGEQLVFKKKLAYTCLAFMSKKYSESLFYAKASIEEVQQREVIEYGSLDYAALDDIRGWNLNKKEILNNISLIENAGEHLGNKYIIKNGIATLANDVFIFRPIKSDAEYYYLSKNGVEYPIEKSVCREIIKPNILKEESDIPEKEERIIYPYDSENKVIGEDYLASQFPYAYKYLCSFREVLDARDKGEGDYGAWYAFGRTQAIADKGCKLLFPYMSDVPHFVYTSQKDMMIYCGYAIYNESEAELLFLKKVLESSVFDYYMRNTSKPYAAGYYSYAKNYVKNFGLYPFTEEQKRHILSLNSKTEINEYIKKVYRVVI